MRSHPFCYSFQFVGGGVTFQVVATPTNERDVAGNVAKSGGESVNAWRISIRPLAFIPIINPAAAARTVWGALYPFHQIGDRKEFAIKGNISPFGAICHSLSQYPRPNSQRGCKQASALLCFFRLRMALHVQLPSTWQNALSVSSLPFTQVFSPAGAANRIQSMLTVLVGAKVFKRGWPLRAAACAFAFNHKSSLLPRLCHIYRQYVWGDQVNSTIEMEVAA